MKKIYLFALMLGSLQLAAQPSLKKMKASLAKKANTNFSMAVNEQEPTHASVQLKPSSNISRKSAPQWIANELALRPGVDVLIQKQKPVEYKNNISMDRLEQWYQGIKVEHGNIVIASKNGLTAYYQMEFYPVADNFSIVPTITEAAALENAKTAVGASKYMWEGYTGTIAKYQKPKAQLVIVQDEVVNIGQMRLAYKFDIYAETPLSRSYIYIDAQTGKKIFTDAILKHANSNGSGDTRYSGNQPIITDDAGTVASKPYTLNQERNDHSIVTLDYARRVSSAANDGLASNFNDNDNNWTTAEYSLNYDNAALDVHNAMQYISDYWKNVHNRNSWDNNDGEMRSYVHIRETANAGYDNAYWDGQAMNYGDGSYYNANGSGTVSNNNGFKPLTSIDVSAHELGHAVCQETAGLVYQRESGAMNEGFSDIWGACVEHYSGLLGSKNNFLIGEEISNSPLRSMINPNLYDQPDTYLGTDWFATTGTCSNNNDQCGVHYNSGVLNRWFYVLVTGASGTNDNGDAYTVAGQGFTKAEQIVYLTEQGLTPNATYADCRVSAINAAVALFGGCSPEVEGVIRAWYSVGVGENFTDCNPKISFRDVTASISEKGNPGICPAATTLNVKMMVNGFAAIAGGPAVVTISATGTATNGEDYMLGSNTVTFFEGDTDDKDVQVNIFDDGAVEGKETITLNFTLNANGGNAAAATTNKQCVITINDDDFLPGTGATENHTIGANTITLNQTAPFHSVSRSSRTQYIYPAAVLASFGAKPNLPISAMAINVLTKASTTAFTDYTISLGNTNAADVSAGFVTGLTQVFSGNYITAVGTNTFNLSPATFTWDGVSNLAVQICFSNAAAGTGNDNTEGYTGEDANTTAWVGSTAATGCTLPFATTNITTFTPRYTFTQSAPLPKVETVAGNGKTWPVSTGSNTYFYSSLDGELVANLDASDKDLGCVTAVVAKAGNGFETAVFDNTVKRSLKEFIVSPTTNGETAKYNATFFFTNEELAGADTAKLYLVKTDAAVDEDINGVNTQLVKPTIINSADFKGFKGSFTGFSRYFLIDSELTLPIKLVTFTGRPLGNDIQLNWLTENESNNRGFDILRSEDGVHFSPIGYVASKGNSVSTLVYSYTDKNMAASKMLYYRLRQIDKNGRSTLSNIVKIASNGRSLISINPNPVKDRLFVQVGNLAAKAEIAIYNATGQQVFHQQYLQPAAQITISVSKLPAGTYFVQVSNGDMVEKQTIIKQ